MGRLGLGEEKWTHVHSGKSGPKDQWHYTTTILRLRIGAPLMRYRNCKFHNFARTISRHADGISRYSLPPSAGPLLPLHVHLWSGGANSKARRRTSRPVCSVRVHGRTVIQQCRGPAYSLQLLMLLLLTLMTNYSSPRRSHDSCPPARCRAARLSRTAAVDQRLASEKHRHGAGARGAALGRVRDTSTARRRRKVALARPRGEVERSGGSVASSRSRAL